MTGIRNESRAFISQITSRPTNTKASDRDSQKACEIGAVGNAQKVKMTCGAKTRSGKPCQKPPLQGKKRCRLHGGLSPKGADHWNFQHGRCTLESRKQTVEGNSYLKQIEELAVQLGMIQRKRR